MSALLAREQCKNGDFIRNVNDASASSGDKDAHTCNSDGGGGGGGGGSGGVIGCCTHENLPVTSCVPSHDPPSAARRGVCVKDKTSGDRNDKDTDKDTADGDLSDKNAGESTSEPQPGHAQCPNAGEEAVSSDFCRLYGYHCCVMPGLRCKHHRCLTPYAEPNAALSQRQCAGVVKCTDAECGCVVDMPTCRSVGVFSIASYTFLFILQSL
jgi:hypothetical protein